MNNTKTLAMFAVFIAVTLVVGTFSATTTMTQSAAFAYSNNKKADENGKNGNTITSQKCKQEQGCENIICNHSGENATCTEEGVVVVIPTPTSTSRTPTTTTTPQPGTGILLVRKVCVTFQGAGCDPNFHFPIQVTGNNPQPSTFVLTPDSSQLVTLGPGTYTITEGQPPRVPISATFSGKCIQSGLFTASGTISAGENQTCMINNLRLVPPAPPPPG
jgi:hypothetical protein